MNQTDVLVPYYKSNFAIYLSVDMPPLSLFSSAG